MGLKAIKRSNITEQVFEQLKQQIITGIWARGDRIPSENELAEIFDVSRITVRQALQKLAALGLIETRVGEGSFITNNIESRISSMIPLAYLGENDVFQVLEFRRVIEIESAGLAAIKATEDDIAELKKILEQMERNKNFQERFAALDLDFHFKIAAMTRNDLIIRTHTILKDILGITMQDIVGALGHEIGICYHRRLVESIESHNYELTKSIMAEHLTETIKDMQRSGKRF